MLRAQTIVAASAVAVIVAGCTEASSTGPPGSAEVVRVVDGDTIDVSIAGRTERVRLIGIDTPEVEHPASGDRAGNPAECYGPDASTHTDSLLPVGTGVRLVRDTVGRDDYGRLLAYVYRASDELFVNLDLVEGGFATPLTIEPNSTFAAWFVAAARTAEVSGTGLWSAC